MTELIAESHPFFVHFPIALIIAAGVAQYLYIRKGVETYSFTALFLTYGAAAMGVVAAVVGLVAASQHSYTGELASDFTLHRVFGLVLPVVIFLTAGFGAAAARTQSIAHRRLFSVFLAIAVIIALVTGFLGAELVHDLH